jgi:hypothetical protein
LVLLGMQNKALGPYLAANIPSDAFKNTAMACVTHRFEWRHVVAAASKETLEMTWCAT